MALSQELTIDIARRGTPHLPAKQADHGYDIIITILQDGVNIVDHTTDTASYRVQKPDGNAVYDSCTVNNDDTVTFHIDDDGQILAVAGYVAVDISIEQNGDVKSTQNFILDVQAAPGGSAIESSSEFIELQNLVASTQALNEDAEAYAAGTRDGVAVTSGDPAYENNAKYYNTQAQSAAQGAVRYDAEQTLTDAQKAQALENINAAATDGYYEDLTAGSADQLIATVTETNRVPYNYRTTGGSADVGNRRTMTITGGTVAWNQQGRYLNRRGTKPCFGVIDANVSAESERSMTVVNVGNTSYWLAPPTGHKILATFKLTQEGNSTYQVQVNFGGNIKNCGVTLSANVTENIAVIGQQKGIAGGSSYNDLYIYPNGSSGSYVAPYTIADFNVFDLTQMFGSTIADYIYTLEQGNAGDGVAWFRKLFPKDYYAYNAGELMSVRPSKSITVGFNAFDYSAGTAVLLGGNQYQITGNYTTISYTDINGDAETLSIDSDGYFTPTNNGTMTITGGDDSTTCVHLVWSGTHDGEYEAYEEHTYDLDNTLTLRGIPKLDADNNLYYDGDTYEPDGTVTRKWGSITLDGTEAWGLGDDGLFYEWSKKTDSSYPVILSNKYIGVRTYALTVNTDKSISSTTTVIRVHDDAYSTVDAFEAALSANPVTLIYELATPTSETATSYTSPQIVNDWGTEEFVDYEVEQGTRDVAVPVGSVSIYPVNLRDKIQHLPDLASGGDGTYLIQQTGTQMSLVADTYDGRLDDLEAKVPDAPSTDGTYVLKVTVSGGTPTYSWVAE